jgi:hypothetical protein
VKSRFSFAQKLSSLVILCAISAFGTGCADQSPTLDRRFGVEGKTSCDEVNQAVGIVLQQHLYWSYDDFDHLYKASLEDMLEGWERIFVAGDSHSHFDADPLRRVFEKNQSSALESLSDCEDLVRIQTEVDLAFLRLEAAENMEYFRFDDRVVFWQFLESFVGLLDPFSAYTRPPVGSGSTGRQFGVRLDQTEILLYGDVSGRLPVFSAHFKSPLKEGDQITHLRLPFAGTEGRRFESLKGRKVPIAEILTSSQFGPWALTELFDSSPAQSMEVWVRRGDEDLYFDLQALGAEEVPPAVVVSREGRMIRIRIFSFSGGEETSLFDSPDGDENLMDLGGDSGVTRQLLTSLKPVLEDYAREFSAGLPEGEKVDPPYYLIDLRDNRGGLLREELSISQMFLGPSDKFGSLRERSSPWKTTTQQFSVDRQEFVADWGRAILDSQILAQHGLVVPLVTSDQRDETYDFHFPWDRMSILLNEASASASETFSQKLLATGRAAIVGKTSFGKLVGQAQIEFKGKFSDRLSEVYHLGGDLRFTVQEHLSPNGGTYSGKGLPPDFEVTDSRRADLLEKCRKKSFGPRCWRLSASDDPLFKKLTSSSTRPPIPEKTSSWLMFAETKKANLQREYQIERAGLELEDPQRDFAEWLLNLDVGF